MEGFVDRVADPVFTWRQDFLIGWRQFAGNLHEQFVGRWILGALGLGEFVADSFFDFLIQLLVLVRSEDAFLNKLLAPTAQRIPLFTSRKFFRRAVKLLII